MEFDRPEYFSVCFDFRLFYIVLILNFSIGFLFFAVIMAGPFIIGISLVYGFGDWEVAFLQYASGCAPWEYVPQLSVDPTIAIFPAFTAARIVSFGSGVRGRDTEETKPGLGAHGVGVGLVLLLEMLKVLDHNIRKFANRIIVLNHDKYIVNPLENCSVANI